MSLVSAAPQTPRLLRDRSGVQRVTNIELFFDLVYVFAITQLSHYLLGHADLRGALQAGLLLLMVWLVWAYTTWVTNWLDPDLMAVRLLLVALMLASLAMSVSLPRAFEDLGLWVGGAYAVQQIGRTVFMMIALRGHPLEANFQRILAWCVASSAFAVAGGLAHGNARALLWLGSVCVDLLGGVVGFYTPGLGRSRTSDWTIEGGHFAERCQGFILIALGESIVIIGADPDREAGHRGQRGRLRGRVRRLGGAVVAVLRPERRGRGREDRPLGRPRPAGPFGLPPGPSRDGGGHHRRGGRRPEGPVRPGRDRQHVVSLDDPGRPGPVPGRARRVQAGGMAHLSWPRVTGIAVLALLGLAATAIPELGLAACAAGVVAAVAASDRLPGSAPAGLIRYGLRPTPQ